MAAKPGPLGSIISESAAAAAAAVVAVIEVLKFTAAFRPPLAAPLLKK